MASITTLPEALRSEIASYLDVTIAPASEAPRSLCQLSQTSAAMHDACLAFVKAMATAVMEKRAREIFRHALLKHYIDEIPCGAEVHSWLKTHGGWFPDSQETYGDGTPLTQPVDEGVDVASKEPETALREAKNVMEILWPTLDDEDADLANSISDWIRAFIKWRR